MGASVFALRLRHFFDIFVFLFYLLWILIEKASSSGYLKQFWLFSLSAHSKGGFETTNLERT